MYKNHRNNKVKNSNIIIKDEFNKHNSFIDDEPRQLPHYVYDYFRTTSAQSADLKSVDQKPKKSNDTSNNFTKQRSSVFSRQHCISPPPISVTPIEIFTNENYKNNNIINNTDNINNTNGVKFFSLVSRNSRPIHRKEQNDVSIELENFEETSFDETWKNFQPGNRIIIANPDQINRIIKILPRSASSTNTNLSAKEKEVQISNYNNNNNKKNISKSIEVLKKKSSLPFAGKLLIGLIVITIIAIISGATAYIIYDKLFRTTTSQIKINNNNSSSNNNINNVNDTVVILYSGSYELLMPFNNDLFNSSSNAFIQQEQKETERLKKSLNNTIHANNTIEIVGFTNGSVIIFFLANVTYPQIIFQNTSMASTNLTSMFGNALYSSFNQTNSINTPPIDLSTIFVFDTSSINTANCTTNRIPVCCLYPNRKLPKKCYR